MSLCNFQAAAGLDEEVVGRGWQLLLKVILAPCSSRFPGPQPSLSVALGCPPDKLWNPVCVCVCMTYLCELASAPGAPSHLFT